MSSHSAPARGEAKRRLSYDVRVWTIRIVNGAKGRRYQVRWTVAGEIHYSTFATKALADSHQAKLKTAAREGEAFDVATGLPLSMVGQDHEDQDHEVSWYEFACAYVDMKWPEVSPNSRRSIADSLATATSALLSSQRGAPQPDHLRKALYGWAFNVKQRELTPSSTLSKTITWIERNTVPLADLAEPDTLRRVLNQLARKQDGAPAAPTVVARKRAVLFNLLNYAVDKKHFPMNPLVSVTWKSPKVAKPSTVAASSTFAKLKPCWTPWPSKAPWASTWKRSSAVCTMRHCARPKPSSLPVTNSSYPRMSPSGAGSISAPLPRRLERERRSQRTTSPQAPSRQRSSPSPHLPSPRQNAPQAHR